MKLNYKELGFKSGLEIHQQLDTKKLFCDCPSILRSDEPEFKIKRKLHAVRGESGKVDVAAKFQTENEKTCFYEGYDSTCLVELDEEPPHKLNEEALKIALEISLLLNCEIISTSQIMRKTVVDGSNTSGFQRTVMIARDGFIETEGGKVGIDSIYLEEDSARLVKKDESSITYRLDRLGIPLIEIATKPDLKNPKQVKEAALKIGQILRSCKVRRGIGTIRQDLNISIGGSNRVEIKGFQDSKIMEKCVELEVIRQKGFLDKGEKNPPEVRNCLIDGRTEFSRPMPGADRMYPETDLELLHISKEFINKIKKNLPKLREEIEKELKKEGLSEEMIKILFKRKKLQSYKELYDVSKNPKLVGKILFLFLKDIAKKNNQPLEKIEKILTQDVLIFVLEQVYKEKIQERDVKIVLEKIVSGIDLKQAIKLEKKDLVDVEEIIMKLVKSKPGLNMNAYMGIVMKEFKGQIDGKNVMEIIKKFIKTSSSD